MANNTLNQVKDKMSKAVQALSRELATVRAGRANPAILDKVSVDYYGAPTPLNQLASINVPEARMLVIQPYDKSVLGDMEKAIQKADLGLNPTNDGSIIRISIPPLTEERRRELVKVVKKYAEESKVAVRNVRRDGNDELKKLEKNGEITEDELRTLTDDVQKITDESINKIDSIAKEKEKEIMEV
ncbi:ribosome recycling factor [Fredinandcohnia sp. QZ13]|uniref:ribosome recycling factor n=1 Tax=Fredinandcohnia sp. QZ13 TaxID=3073144 RepID=UPI0028534A8F|nr:ribosome recycling factor [Fredinandcohnia sp. QZ13]MDR4886467.1 ribosome recycling factor [Fredinandcohnia sp. QZ13]